MSQEIVKITPEGQDIANCYVQLGDAQAVSKQLNVPLISVMEVLGEPQVQSYLDQVYLDVGFRNRNKIAAALDEIIEAKFEEAKDTEMFTDKDLVDLLALAHKIRIDELKLNKTQGPSTHVQIASIGGDNYSQLMERLLKA